MSELLQEYHHEKRLHPMSLLYRGISNAPAMLIPLYLVLSGGDSEEWVYVLILILSLMITMPAIVLNYIYFSYYITPDELVIKSGVLSKKQRNIPIARIQNIGSEQNFLSRILGLVKVQIETAGGVETEGNLEFVSLKDAEEIEKVIKTYQKEKAEENEETEIIDKDSEEKNKADAIYKLSFKDNVLFGMMRLRPVILIFIAWAFGITQQFDPFFDEFSIQELITPGNLDQMIKFDLTNLILYIIGGIIFILFASWLADILLTINTYYGFSLKKEAGKLFSSQGLLTKRKGTIPLKKLQSLVIKTNPIKKKFGFYSLEIQTAGIGTGGRRSETAVPFARENVILDIAGRIRDFIYPERYRPVSKKTIRRALIRYLMTILPVFIALYFIFSPLLWALILLPLVYVGAYLRYQYRGYAISGDTVFIKQGFIIQRTSIIPIKKIQTLNVRESFFQRRLGLATLHIDTAATSYTGDASVIDIKKEDAFEMMEELSSLFAEYTGRKKAAINKEENNDRFNTYSN
ncbi:MAG: PH domain-containing protein [Candidatus Kapaibacterium sp.]